MNKLKQLLKDLSFKRWEVLIVLLFTTIIIIVKSIILPIANSQITEGKEALTKLDFLKSTNSLDGKLLSLEKRISKVDSLINMSDNRESFSEPVIIEKIYNLAEQAGCNISKVQIEEPTSLNIGLEIPVMLKCSGNYEAIGKFTDGIENMNHATRIRQFSLKNIQRGNGEVSIEFVIMENRGVISNEG